MKFNKNEQGQGIGELLIAIYFVLLAVTLVLTSFDYVNHGHRTFSDAFKCVVGWFF